MERQDSLIQITNLLNKIGDKIKCPICFQVIQDVRELSCGHRFCNDCLIQHKLSQKCVSCPLCKAAISRRSPMYKDEYSDHVGKFVHKLCEYLKFISNPEVQHILQENKPNDNNINTKLKSTKVLVDCQPSSSKSKSNKDTSINVKKAWDKSITFNSLLLNKVGTKNTYLRKQKPKQSEPEFLNYKLHNFDNSENKLFVLKWLNDNKNKFDRLTQTQNVSNEEDDKNILILPSVSQIKESDKFIENKNFKVRSKSEEKEMIKNGFPRRRTHSTLSKASDNYHIEDIGTEEEKVLEKAQENVLLDIIEKEYINKLDDGIENTAKSRKQKKSKASSIKKESTNENGNTTQNSTTDGWNRMTEIKKSINTSSKVPKKLKVIQNSSKCSNVRKNQKENLALTANIKIIENPKHALRKFKSKETNISEIRKIEVKKLNEETKVNKEVNVNKNSYDLDALESYIAQNISMEYNKDYSTDLAMSNNTEFHKNLCTLKNEDDHKNFSISNTNEKSAVLSSTVLEKGNDEVYLVPTQKLNCSNNKKEFAESIEDIIPTQKLPVENNENVNIDPVQPVLQQYDRICFNNDDDVTVMHMDSPTHLLNLLEGYLKSSFKTVKDSTQLENNLTSMDIILKKIKSIYSCLSNKDIKHQSTQTEVEKVDEIIQTSGINNNEKGTQTNLNKNRSVSTQIDINFVDKAMQTNMSDETNNASRANNNDGLENVVSEPEFSTKYLSRPQPSVKSLLSSKTQNEIFTCSLDTLNLDTQEIIRNKILQPSYTSKIFNNNADKNVVKCSENSIPKPTNSQLICTIQSSTSGKLKRSRMREQNHSSESDEDIKPIIKRNRFLNDNLSVEFSTSTRIDSSEQENKTPDSNSINYDECLDQILKKYDEQLIRKPEIVGSLGNKNKQCDTTNPKDLLNVKQNSEFNDVISESESLESVPKKPKLIKLDRVIMGNNNFESTEFTTDSKKQVNDICDELNDSLEDIDFENIAFPNDQNGPLKSHINILEDIVIQNPQQELKNNEGDIFSDDDDIVDSTPQKNLPDKQSQKTQKSRVELIFSDNTASKITESCDLNVVVLPPPPGFQDFELDEEQDDSKVVSTSDITVIKNKTQNENMESCTSKILSLSIKKHEEQGEQPSQKKSYLQDLKSHHENIHKSSSGNENRIEHSTPFFQSNDHHQSVPCISPIPKEEQNNLIDTLQSSLSSLVTTPKRQIPKHTILSSTPKQKSIWNYVKTSQELENGVKLKPKPCISCTRLNTSQVMSISQLTNKKLATYSSIFHKDVTHMIVAVDGNNCLKDYTAKFVAAVAAGIWVLRFDWIQDSLNKNMILPEESYEVFDDVCGVGPKTSRLTKKEHPLFKGFKFHCTNDFFSTTKKEIEDIIKMLDGELVEKPEHLVKQDGKIGLIITEGRATEDFEIYESWLELYKVATVDIEWLSRSVGRYKLLSIRPYIWCSDNNLEDLGYPEYLIEQVPFSSE